MPGTSLRFSFVILAIIGLAAAIARADEADEDAPKPIAISEIKRETPVDFETEILPLFKASCLACHNHTDAQSDLVLETPETILKGGANGAVVIPSKSGESRLLKIASHGEEPIMPPEDNDAGAVALVPDQLGLLKLWIDQGATGEVKGTAAVKWQPLPPGVNPIYSVAVTADGEYAACGRANQIFVYHLPSQKLLCRLTDPHLTGEGTEKTLGIAHRDIVQSLAFSADGYTLASGGYRVVKLWQRPQNTIRHDLAAAEGAVTAVAVSPQGNLLATGGADQNIRLWKLPAGEAGPVISGHSGAVNGLCFAADGTVIYSASADGSIRGFKTDTGESVLRIDTPAAVNDVTLAAGGAEIISAGDDHLLRTWTLPVAPARSLAGSAGPTTGGAVSPDGKYLASICADGRVELIDVTSGASVRTWSAHSGAVNDVAWSADSARLTTAGADGYVKLWEAASGNELASLATGAGAATAVELLASDGQVLIGTADGSVLAWDGRPGDARELAPAVGSEIAATATNRERNLQAAATTKDGQPVILIRDTSNGSVVHTLTGHKNDVTAMAFSRHGTRLASGAADGTVLVWNLVDGSVVAKCRGHEAAVTTVAFHSGVAQVVSGAADGSVKLWDAAAGKVLRELGGHGGALLAIHAADDGTSIFTISADQKIRRFLTPEGDEQIVAEIGSPSATAAIDLAGNRVAVATPEGVKLFDAAGKASSVCAGSVVEIAALKFSADGGRLAARTADSRVLVWDAATGDLIGVLPSHAGLSGVEIGPDGKDLLLTSSDGAMQAAQLAGIRAIARQAAAVVQFQQSPNGKTVYVASERNVSALMLVDGKQLYSIDHPAAIRDVAISPDGKWLAVAAADGKVRLWNAADGKPAPQAELGGFAGAVQRVVFSPDSTRVMAGTEGGEILIHNVASGMTEQAFREHPAAITAIGTTGEGGATIVSAATDQSIRLWQPAATRQFAGHTGPVTSVVTLPDGKQIVSGSADGSVRQWDVAAGKEIRTMDHGGPVTAVAVRPDGARIASAGENQLVRLWNAADGKQIAEMKGDSQLQRVVDRLAYLASVSKQKADAAVAAVTAGEANVKAKAEATAKAAEALAAAEKAMADKEAAAKAPVEALAAADQLVADTAAAAKKATEDKASAEKTAQDAATAAKAAMDELARVKAAAEAQAAVATTSATALAALKAASENNSADKQLAESFQTAQKIADEADKTNKTLAGLFAARQKVADDSAAAAKNATEMLALADKMVAETAAAAKDAADKQKPAAEAAKKATDELNAAKNNHAEAMRNHANAQTDDKLAAQSLEGAKATATTTAAVLTEDEAQLAAGQSGDAAREKPIRCLAFSPDGMTLAAGGDDATIQLYRSETGEGKGSLSGHAGAVLALAFTGDGGLVSASADKSTKIWEPAPDWTYEATLGPADAAAADVSDSPFTDRVLALAFSPDGKYLATGGGEPSRNGELMIWDVAQRKIVHNIADAHSDTVFGVAFSYDGKYLASGAADKFVKVFDVAEGKFVKAFEGHTHHVLDVAWRTDGSTLASCGADDVVKVWNVDTGEQRRTIGGFGKQVTSITFIGTTQNTLAASGDKTVRRYNVDDGKSDKTFSGGTDFMQSVATTPGGTLVVAGGQDSVLRVWDADGKAVVTFAPPAEDNETAQK